MDAINVFISDDSSWADAIPGLGATSAARDLDDRVLLIRGREVANAPSTGPPLWESLPGLDLYPDAKITGGEYVDGIGLVLTVELEFQGQDSTVLIRRWRNQWRWYVILPGHTGVSSIAGHGGGLFFGSKQGWGYFSRSEGLCETKGELQQIRRVLALENGTVFLLGKDGADEMAPPAYQWLFP